MPTANSITNMIANRTANYKKKNSNIKKMYKASAVRKDTAYQNEQSWRLSNGTITSK